MLNLMKKVLVALFMSVSFIGAVFGSEVVDVSPKQVAEMLEKKEAPQVIDVRTEREFAQGHIKGATLIDVTAKDFEEKVSKLDPKKSYIVHCRSGSRSTRAMKVFKSLKFQKIYHMNKGMNAWTNAGLPSVK